VTAYLNRVSTAVPRNDVHALFVDFASGLLAGDRKLPLFQRLASRSQIEHRWSVLTVAENPDGAAMDSEGLYRPGAFASTAARMAVFDKHAPALAERAVDGLGLGETAKDITHVIVTGCTGLSAPGLDLHLVGHLGLKPSTERTVIGFMGCYAAINALKLARHIVRSDQDSRVLILSLEFCTLHLQETTDLEQVLSFLVFGDGAAAALVSAEPTGLRLDSFHAALAPEAAGQITWDIGDQGFDMVLSGQVPASVGAALKTARDDILGDAALDEIDLWAVHPGGRSVLDAVETALALPPQALADSREVLRRFGNMSSATILFVLEALMARAKAGERGVGMAFGPGLTAETFRFTAQP
jgi:alpha-pyrone synthase